MGTVGVSEFERNLATFCISPTAHHAPGGTNLRVKMMHHMVTVVVRESVVRTGQAVVSNAEAVSGPRRRSSGRLHKDVLTPVPEHEEEGGHEVGEGEQPERCDTVTQAQPDERCGRPKGCHTKGRSDA